MGRPKGSKSGYTRRSAEEKYELIRVVLEGDCSAKQLAKRTGINPGTISAWVKKYTEGGMEALKDERKPGSPIARYANTKHLTKLEQAEYENMQLKIENARAPRTRRRIGQNESLHLKRIRSD